VLTGVGAAVVVEGAIAGPVMSLTGAACAGAAFVYCTSLVSSAAAPPALAKAAAFLASWAAI